MSALVTPESDIKHDGSARWIKVDAQEFCQKFNRTSFTVQHEPADHTLVQLPALMELAERPRKQRPNDIYQNGGEIGVNQKWMVMSGSRVGQVWESSFKKGLLASCAL